MVESSSGSCSGIVWMLGAVAVGSGDEGEVESLV